MDVYKYLEEAIKLELNASDTYFLFSQKFKEDHDFWWELANEELNHAAILKTALEIYKINEFPTTISQEDIDELIKLNNEFDIIEKKFMKNPNRQMCFEIALEIESSAGESHYQELMDENTDDRILKVLQELNKDDTEHYARIKKYYGDHIV